MHIGGTTVDSNPHHIPLMTPACHGMTSLLSSLISFPLCLCPAPSPSPSDSIQPHLPAFHHLRSNSEVYLCNHAMPALRPASDYHQTYLDLIPLPRGTAYLLLIICLILAS